MIERPNEAGFAGSEAVDVGIGQLCAAIDVLSTARIDGEDERGVGLRWKGSGDAIRWQRNDLHCVGRSAIVEEQRPRINVDTQQVPHLGSDIGNDLRECCFRRGPKAGARHLSVRQRDHVGVVDEWQEDIERLAVHLQRNDVSGNAVERLANLAIMRTARCDGITSVDRDIELGSRDTLKLKEARRIGNSEDIGKAFDCYPRIGNRNIAAISIGAVRIEDESSDTRSRDLRHRHCAEVEFADATSDTVAVRVERQAICGVDFLAIKHHANLSGGGEGLVMKERCCPGRLGNSYPSRHRLPSGGNDEGVVVHRLWRNRLVKVDNHFAPQTG